METQRRKITLIATDIDGTLLNSQHKISPRTKKALKDALAQGVKVMFATGKTYTSAVPFFKELGITTPGVFNQGTSVHNADGSVRYQQSLSPDLLRTIIPYVESRGYCVVVYSGQKLLIKKPDTRADIYEQYHEPKPEVIGSLTNALETTAFNKLIIAGDDAKAARAMFWQMQQMIGKTAMLTFAGIPNQFEILPLGVSKGKTTAALCKELGIPAENVLGIGDAENDTDLIQFAGIGVAMGNAPDAIKAIANHVVGTSDEDGLADAIERFVLVAPIAVPVVPVAEAVVIVPPAVVAASDAAESEKPNA